MLAKPNTGLPRGALGREKPAPTNIQQRLLKLPQPTPPDSTGKKEQEWLLAEREGREEEKTAPEKSTASAVALWLTSKKSEGQKRKKKEREGNEYFLKSTVASAYFY